MSNSYLRRENPDGSTTILFPLEPATIHVIELARDGEGQLTAAGYELDGYAPITRRAAARVLRALADNYEATADALTALEPQL